MSVATLRSIKEKSYDWRAFGAVIIALPSAFLAFCMGVGAYPPSVAPYVTAAKPWAVMGVAAIGLGTTLVAAFGKSLIVPKATEDPNV